MIIMVEIRKLIKAPRQEKMERIIDKKYSPANEKIQDINDILDNTTYYVATINNLDIPIILFDKMVQQKRPSEQIKITREKFNELKNQKYFYTETVKEEPDGKRIIGVEVILKPADVTHHHELERILKQSSKIEQIEEIKEIQIEAPKIKTQCTIKSPSPSFSSPNLNIKFDRDPSTFQIDIFSYVDRIVNNDPIIIQKNMLVEAGPGSGKTWTIEQASKIVARSHKTCCFLAFNTHITDEFRPRAPAGVDVSTLNSAGNKFVWKKMQDTRRIKTLNKHNVSKVIDYLRTKNKYSDIKYEDFNKLKAPARKLVDLYKATLLDINNATLLELIDKHNIDIDFENPSFMSDLIELCKDTIFINYNIFTNTWENFDFNDQWWLPVVYRGEKDQYGNINIKEVLDGKQYDVVFVDETQDLNKAQIELCKKMCKPNGSIICVGDRNQAIYGFRGADVNSIPNIIKELNPKIFLLPIVYRCPKEHIKLVKEFARNLPDADYTRDFKISVEQLQYATIENAGYEAIDGEIIENYKNSKILSEAKPGDLIISRINAALIKPYLELIKQSIAILPKENRPRIILLGKHFGEDLIALIDKIIIKMNKEDKDYTVNEFQTTLTYWKLEQIEKLTKKNLSTENVTDMYETLMIFTDEFEDIDTIRTTAETIFSDEDEEGKKKGAKITLGTIHKAKGGEVDTKENNLFIIRTFKGKSIFPLEFSNAKDWQKTQENNLVYVAYTRGKNKMYLVDL